MEQHFREIIEKAGAEFVALYEGSAHFRDTETGKPLSLYAFACDPENVRLSLKNAREPQPIGFESLERAEAL